MKEDETSNLQKVIDEMMPKLRKQQSCVHCWHHTGRDKICCECGKTVTEHGPHLPNYHNG